MNCPTPSHTTPNPISHGLVSASWQQATLNQITRLGKAILNYLTQTDEPKIVQQTHHNRNTVWTIYVPRSNQRVTCSSEAEVRVWLEQYYNFH